MKNNDNISSDLEVGRPPVASDSPSRPDNTSTTEGLALPEKEVVAKLKNSLPRFFRRCTLTKNTTQQMALVVLCVAGAILDPLFFYLPMINKDSKCMKFDRKLAAVAISLRTLVDVLHVLLWGRYYSKKWKYDGSKSAATAPATASAVAAAAAASTVTSSEENKEISKGNSNSLSPRNSKAIGLVIEILSILPFPQVATLAILIIQCSPRSQQAVTLLKFSVLSQFVIRIFQIFPSFQEAMTNSFTLLKRRFWIGAGFNLLLFVIVSHVLGAFWYLLSVGRTMDCWKSACRKRVGCNIDSLYCGGPTDNKSYLDDYCPIQEATNSSAFNFGIYLRALESNIVGSTRFPLKLGYCFWWGLQNLSSLGQNLEASAYEWEILFSICISVLGLILFSFFIGNMQAFFQYRTNEQLKKMDKILKKQKELFKWKLFQWLPRDLQENIKLSVEDKWLKTTEVDLKTTLDNLPEDLSKKIKEGIFSKLQKKVGLFRTLNIQAQDMFNYMKPEVFVEGSPLFPKDRPIDKIVFVLNGKLTKQPGMARITVQDQQVWDARITVQDLQVWDFCSKELLREIITNSQKDQSSKNQPTWTVDIKACTKVEAFILDGDDLQTHVNESKKIIESKVKEIRKGLFKWKPFCQLPEDLKAQILWAQSSWCVDPRWLQNKKVDLKGVLNTIAPELRSQIKEKLCSPLLSKVPQFGELDDQPLKMLCNHAKPEIFLKNSYVFQADKPIKQVIFIVCGEVCSYKKEIGESEGSPQKLTVEYLGDEILNLNFSSKALTSFDFPVAPRHIKAVTKVEAFILTVKDLMEVWYKFGGRLYKFEMRPWAETILVEGAMRRRVMKATKMSAQDAQANSPRTQQSNM